MPLLGDLILVGAFVIRLRDNADPDNSETQISVFGRQTGGVFVISVGALLLGQVVVPPLSVAELREAEAEARGDDVADS